MGRVDARSVREPGLDTLRACAIVAVMSFHLIGVLPKSWSVASQFGWMGVDLFFVLSGYLIGSQLLLPYASGQRPSISQFYRRRFFRILPAYLVVVALYAGWPAWRETRGFGPLWKFLTFTENFFFDPYQRSFSHVWSLCVEEHFYLVLPLLVAAMMRRPSARRTGVLIAALVLGGIALRGVAVTHQWDFYKFIYYPTEMRLDGLLAGVTLALGRAFRPAWWAAMTRRGHASFFSGLALVAAVMWTFRGEGMGDETGWPAAGMILGLPVLALGLGLIVASSLSDNGLLKRGRVPGAQTVATLAYALYLTHKAVVHLDRRYLPALTSGQDLKAAAVYAISCAAAAGLLHFAVERPFLRLRDWLEGRPARQIEYELESEPAL
jgi:peptidoglycan/LPS O-acetylase OafA/YrhL